MRSADFAGHKLLLGGVWNAHLRPGSIIGGSTDESKGEEAG